MALPLTPSQTIGPFFHHALPWPDGPYVVPESATGRLRIEGRILDAEGSPVPDALVETWQADPGGRFASPDDPLGPSPSGFRGFGRCPTDADGRFFLVTVRPGPVPAPDGRAQAPHLGVGIFARGLGQRVVTRLYFSDEIEANAADPVLGGVGDDLGATLVGRVEGDVVRHEIHLGGPRETVFFEI